MNASGVTLRHCLCATSTTETRLAWPAPIAALPAPLHLPRLLSHPRHHMTLAGCTASNTRGARLALTEQCNNMRADWMSLQEWSAALPTPMV